MKWQSNRIKKVKYLKTLPVDSRSMGLIVKVCVLCACVLACVCVCYCSSTCVLSCIYVCLCVCVCVGVLAGLTKTTWCNYRLSALKKITYYMPDGCHFINELTLGKPMFSSHRLNSSSSECYSRQADTLLL